MISVTRPEAADANEIESFYQDTSKLIRLLLHVVNGVLYGPQDTAEVYRFHAGVFWAGVCGERTEGHPNYQAPPRISTAT
ncbi:MAG TPA: hypothetical protein VFR54_06775 [Xanthobacteraceae bacterium]|nr:hypothetical protein [Xanthobacteraceae bacterium]